MLYKLKSLFYWIPLVLFLLLGLYLWKGLTLEPQYLPSTLINKPAPAFNGPALSNTHQLIDQRIFHGKVTLFHVWASWCGVCKMEQPFLNELAKQKQVQLIGLNYKDQQMPALAVLKKGNPYAAVIFDNKGHIGMDWGVYGTPETFLIDKQGIVRYKYTGMMTAEIWKEKFLPLINQLLIKRLD